MLRPYRSLRRSLGYMNQEQIQRIRTAYRLAAKAHRGQRRQSGESYISHPVAVAMILADFHMDHESVIAALLHDVLEDTDVEKVEIVELFGQSVADLVDGVTKLARIDFKDRAEAHAESFRKMVLAMSHDIRVILIKLADRLHNLQTIAICSYEKRSRIAKETLSIFAPIAYRLGMHELSQQLKDLALLAWHPQRYRVLQSAVKKARGNRKEILHMIMKSLKEGLNTSPITDFKIIGREKHISGIYRKMCDKKLSFSEIMDVYGFRILVGSIDDCYRMLGVVHKLYKPRLHRFKDYIAIPKVNGY
jgi:GTP diphosphokinase / guanosine-3',5'-bis(diphosphate) 3'-diphosphatase